MKITAPPNNAAVDDAYVIPAGATGAWTGHAQKLAEWGGVKWRIISTRDGHGVSLPDGQVFQRVGGVYVEKIAQDVQSGKWNDAEAGATANALTVSLTQFPGGHTAGMLLNIIIPFDCDELATLSVNGLPAKPVVRGYDQRPLVEKDWCVDRIVTLVYDGEQFQLLNIDNVQAPLNRIVIPTAANALLSPKSAGSMNYFYLVGPVVYTPPKAKDFGINYIGFLRNKGNPITIHTAGGEDGVIALEDGWVELTDEQYALWVCEQHFLWFYGELVQNPLIVQTLLSVQTTLKVIIDKQAETERLAMVRP